MCYLLADFTRTLKHCGQFEIMHCIENVVIFLEMLTRTDRIAILPLIFPFNLSTDLLTMLRFTLHYVDMP